MAFNSLDYKKELELVRNQNIDITNFETSLLDFKTAFSRNYDLASKQFNTAIEEKQVAEQKALKEKNVLKQIEYQNEQKVAKARADSTEMAIKMATLKSQSGKEYLMLKWIEKWNGQLPNMMPGDSKIIPMVNGI